MIPKHCLKQFPTRIANDCERKTESTPRNIFIIKKSENRKNIKLHSKQVVKIVRKANTHN